MMMSENHEKFIRRSIKIAESAMSKGNHPFGALLVLDGEIIVEAENIIYSEPDATGHAETNLVRIASKLFDQETLSKCTMYTSTEPCIMCTGAAYWAGIPRIVYGCSSTTLGEHVGKSLLIPSREVLARGARKVEVIGPILEEESLAVLLRYFKK
jgi:tRNA(Arg) A34 adenosine deaminase TadA